MSYVSSNLINGERILYESKMSVAPFIAPLFLLAIFLLVLYQINSYIFLAGFFLYIFLILRIVVAYFTTEYAITNRRVIYKVGLFSSGSVEIMLSKVESVTLKQSLWGKIFNYGNLIISGSGGTNRVFKSMKKPNLFRKKLNKYLPVLN